MAWIRWPPTPTSCAANAQELDLLFKEMLIGVTSFFRDPEVWQDLQDKVLPVLLAQHPGGAGPMRAWVAGCSTGEEAYSLAMAFIEALDALPAHAGANCRSLPPTSTPTRSLRRVWAVSPQRSPTT
jgi:hypothetical protein